MRTILTQDKELVFANKITGISVRVRVNDPQDYCIEAEILVTKIVELGSYTTRLCASRALNDLRWWLTAAKSDMQSSHWQTHNMPEDKPAAQQESPAPEPEAE